MIRFFPGIEGKIRRMIEAGGLGSMYIHAHSEGWEVKMHLRADDKGIGVKRFWLPAATDIAVVVAARDLMVLGVLSGKVQDESHLDRCLRTLRTDALAGRLSRSVAVAVVPEPPPRKVKGWKRAAKRRERYAALNARGVNKGRGVKAS